MKNNYNFVNTPKKKEQVNKIIKDLEKIMVAVYERQIKSTAQQTKPNEKSDIIHKSLTNL